MTKYHPNTRKSGAKLATLPHKPDGYHNRWLQSQISTNADEINTMVTEIIKLIRANDQAKDMLTDVKDKAMEIRIWSDEIERGKR